MIKEITLTIFLVTGSPESITTPHARNIVELSVKQLNQIPYLRTQFKRVRWVKVRNKVVERQNEQRFYKWNTWLNRQVRRKNLNTPTDFSHLIDVPRESLSRGGLAYICSPWAENYSVSWSSVSGNAPAHLMATLITHEIAHTLGAEHVNEKGNIMDTFMLQRPTENFYTWSEKSFKKIKKCLQLFFR